MTQARKPSPGTTGAGVPEVTEEMYEAGRQVLEEVYVGDGVYCIDQRCLTAMYLAMDAVRRGVAPVEPLI